jgi:outer membrane biosynthesis protein TonB
LVIEKQDPNGVAHAAQSAGAETADNIGTAPTAEPAVSASSTSTSSPSTKVPTGVAPSTKPANGSASPAALSSTFARQQPRIEACFAQHAREVEGRPQIAVRFGVDENGTVQKAEVIPAMLGSAPLGACVLSVARSTKFGEVGKPLSFTIPITARRVTK